MKKNYWMIIALLFIGFSGGIVVGVVVDEDQVYHTTVKRLKQKDSPGATITIDQETELPRTRKEQRQIDREHRRAEREKNRESR